MEVYTRELELLDLLEQFDSVLWEARAFASGSFSVSAPLTEKNRALLAPENILWIAGESAGIIEQLGEEAGESGTNIVASGRLLTGLLARRILWGPYTLYGTGAWSMTKLVNDCAIEPVNAARRLPHLSAAAVPTGGEAARRQNTGGNLLTVLSRIGAETLTAFGVRFDARTPSMEFWTRRGVDRSTAQSEREPVLYSTELDDVLASSYAYDSTQYMTAALIAGEGEGAVRSYASVDDGLTGFDRRELFVDARDLSSSTESGTLTPEQYAQALRSRGAEKLAEHPLTQTFDATVRTLDPTYVYGEDFFLGDVITVTDERLGVSADAVVTAVQRWASRSGEGMSLTFGFGRPTVAEILRRTAE